MLSYDQVNEHCSFGHFTQAELVLSGFGQYLGHPKFGFRTWFLHQSYAIMCLVSFPIGFAPIEPIQLKLRLSNLAGLTPSPAGHSRQHL